jgi:sugar lactone lactonase YvrE
MGANYRADAQSPVQEALNSMPKIIPTAILTATLAASAWSQTPAPTAEAPNTPAALNEAAMKAYQAKDYAAFLANEKRALDLQPGTPRLIYNVACGEALQGNAAEAVRRLESLVARKLDLGAEADDDFAGIRNTPDWVHFLASLKELRKPILRSQVAFRLDDPGLIATGVAVDPASGDTYIASIRERKILRRSSKGVVSDFIDPAQDDIFAAVQLAIDPARKLLYATASTAPFMLGYRKEDGTPSGLFAFDVRTGKLARKALLAPDDKRHFLNGLTIDSKGAVYVADSLVGEIFVLRPGATELELFLPPGVFRSTQGLSFSADEKTLYVVDFTNGLWALDMATKKPRRIEAPADAFLVGLDGLSQVPGGFICVQLGVQPNRVVRLVMDPGFQKIARVETLESNHPDYDGPIHGAVHGKDFIYVANSQFSLTNGETGAFAADKAKPTVVLKMPF